VDIPALLNLATGQFAGLVISLIVNFFLYRVWQAETSRAQIYMTKVIEIAEKNAQNTDTLAGLYLEERKERG
jgi:hypothetical protein